MIVTIETKIEDLYTHGLISFYTWVECNRLEISSLRDLCTLFCLHKNLYCFEDVTDASTRDLLQFIDIFKQPTLSREFISPKILELYPESQGSITTDSNKSFQQIEYNNQKNDIMNKKRFQKIEERRNRRRQRKQAVVHIEDLLKPNELAFIKKYESTYLRKPALYLLLSKIRKTKTKAAERYCSFYEMNTCVSSKDKSLGSGSYLTPHFEFSDDELNINQDDLLTYDFYKEESVIDLTETLSKLKDIEKLPNSIWSLFGLIRLLVKEPLYFLKYNGKYMALKKYNEKGIEIQSILSIVEGALKTGTISKEFVRMIFIKDEGYSYVLDLCAYCEQDQLQLLKNTIAVSFGFTIKENYIPLPNYYAELFDFVNDLLIFESKVLSIEEIEKSFIRMYPNRTFEKEKLLKLKKFNTSLYLIADSYIGLKKWKDDLQSSLRSFIYKLFLNSQDPIPIDDIIDEIHQQFPFANYDYLLKFFKRCKTKYQILPYGYIGLKNRNYDSFFQLD